MIQRLCFSSCTQMKEPKIKTKFSSFFSLFTNWDNLTILIMGKKSCPSVLQTAVQTQKQMWTILRNIVLQINNMINEKVKRTFHFYNFNVSYFSETLYESKLSYFSLNPFLYLFLFQKLSEYVIATSFSLWSYNFVLNFFFDIFDIQVLHN